MRWSSLLGSALRYAASAVVMVGVVAAPVWLSWRFAAADVEPDTRVRVHLISGAEVRRGTALRDEHLAYRVGRIADADPVPHRSQAVGRYAQVDMRAGDVVTRGSIAATAELDPTADTVLVAVPVKAYYATYLSVGARLAFARAGELSNGEDVDPGERTPESTQLVLGLDEGFPLVALTVTGEADDGVAVLEILLKRDSDLIRRLAEGEWQPVVLPR